MRELGRRHHDLLGREIESALTRSGRVVTVLVHILILHSPTVYWSQGGIKTIVKVLVVVQLSTLWPPFFLLRSQPFLRSRWQTIVSRATQLAISQPSEDDDIRLRATAIHSFNRGRHVTIIVGEVVINIPVSRHVDSYNFEGGGRCLLYYSY